MTGEQRREQLIDVGLALFAERGVDGTSMEEIAAHAGVSKPVVYAHFGGKEELYAVVVDREMQRLIAMVTSEVSGRQPRELLEQGVTAVMAYIDLYGDGFRVLVRDTGHAGAPSALPRLISEIVAVVDYVVRTELGPIGYDERLAPMYARMLVGMVTVTGLWWLEARSPGRDEVADHLINLAWNGLSGLGSSSDPSS